MTDTHVFRPDRKLSCRVCGEGELMGSHGIIAIEDGRQIYASTEIEEMYIDGEPEEDDLFDEDE